MRSEGEGESATEGHRDQIDIDNRRGRECPSRSASESRGREWVGVNNSQSHPSFRQCLLLDYSDDSPPGPETSQS